jgi:chromosome segregation ATPase
LSPQPAKTAPALGGIDRLAAEANRTERLLEDRVRALTEIDSLTDVSPRLQGLETELQNSAKRLEALELSNDLVAPRDGLAQALRSLAETLGDVRSDVENLGGALDALGNLDLSDAEAAIAEIQRLTGG